MKTLLRIPLSARAALALVFLVALLSVGSQAGNRNAYPLPEDRGTAGVLATLEKLPVFVRVLNITSHPDDESSGLLTWLARRAHARTALLSLTRGDGGQNVLGDEKYEAMGLVRTSELLEACKIYGAELYFTTVFEFGFSKSAEETLSKWGHDATLEEVVRFIRTWRPTIVISRFQGNSRDGHGHHQTAGLMAHEAFRAAGDQARFPEQSMQGLRPWQAKKLYRNSPREEADPSQSGATSANQAKPEWTLRLDVGAYDPLLGRSYREIGSEGYSKHRSQGSGASFSLPGRSFDYFKLIDSTVGAQNKEESFFDSIDTSLMAITELAGAEGESLPFLREDLKSVQDAADEALRAFQPRQHAASAAEAAKGLAILTELIRKVQNARISQSTREVLQDALGEKRNDFQHAVNATLGIYLTARTDEATAVPGQKIPVAVTFFNRGSEKVELKRVTLWTPEGWISSLPAGPPLGEIAPGEQAILKHGVNIPKNAKVTEPFWYRALKDDTRYQTRPTKDIFAPFDEPEITAQATYRYQNAEVSIASPTTAQVNDPIRGVDFRDFQVVPALSVVLKPAFMVSPISPHEQTRQFQVAILSNERSSVNGNVSIRTPSGWRVEPATAPFTLSRKGETFTASLTIHVPPGTREGTFPVEAVATMAGQEFRRGYAVISYSENWTRHLYSPSRAELKTFDVKVAPNLTVGYVMGAGDEVPSSLEQLGVKVQMLSASDLAYGDLSRFSTLVTGVRAYNLNEDLKRNNQRLLKYVEQGGTLIVQYNTPIGGRNSPFPYAPYSMTTSASDRITVEDSPLKILDTRNPVFLMPNKISGADFAGWVQERGLYFMNQWDSKYTPLLSGNDPGEDSKNGGMLFARFGKGYYIYTAYAWFRQLPAGVPGAFRIFANMLSLGK